mmetsp:Transcript_34352/g.105260  ORF Transcript_34352/g.105260 Transcript_34352/m.105260 type:complete len:276 (+) Transcript_34352:538-1365(+)
MPLVPRAHQGEALPRQGRLRRGLPGAAPRQDHRPQEDRLRLCQRREPGAAGGVLPAAPLPPRRRPLRGRLSPPARGGRRLRLRRDGVLRRRGPDRPHGVSPRRAAAARGSAGLLPVHAVPHPVLRALLRRAAPRPQAREPHAHLRPLPPRDRLWARAPVPAARRARKQHRGRVQGGDALPLLRLALLLRAGGALPGGVRLWCRRVVVRRRPLCDAARLLPARGGVARGLEVRQAQARAAGRQVHRLDGAAVVRQAAPPDGRGAQPPRRHARHRPG